MIDGHFDGKQTHVEQHASKPSLAQAAKKEPPRPLLTGAVFYEADAFAHPQSISPCGESGYFFFAFAAALFHFAFKCVTNSL
jgi:hypothetical protein